MAEHGIEVARRDGEGEEGFVFYGEYGRLLDGPAAPTSLTEFQLHLLAELGSGETLRGVLRRQGRSDAYSRCAWHVDQAKKALAARTQAHAVAIAIKRGYLSEPTGADMRVIPLIKGHRVPASAAEGGTEFPVEFDTEQTISSFEVNGEPMIGRWGVIPSGWDRPARHFRVLPDGKLALPLTVAPGRYVIRKIISS